MALGRQLKKLRAANAVSMNQVHLETRMSTSYLSKLERDEFLPGEDNLKRIVTALRKLEVDGADVLFKEHRAVQKEREALAKVQERLATLDDHDTKMKLIQKLLADVDRVSSSSAPAKKRQGS